MAHLEVQPKKRSTPWWVWLLLALIILAVSFFLINKSGNGTNQAGMADSTSMNDNSDRESLATTPDWNSVNFDGPKASDPDITDNNISMSENDNYTVYTLGEEILFAKDQSALQPGADEKLQQIVNSLKRRSKDATIGVYGNTDSSGSADYNKELGEERAKNVKEWLTQHGIDGSKVSVQSMGESKPVASNATESGRQKNRYVGIVAFQVAGNEQ